MTPAAVALIDYGAGNLHSVLSALRAAGSQDVAVTDDPEVVLGAERVVLPGVGSFGACMAGLRAVPGLVDALEERVLRRGAPFLGVCVGMQLLATRGLEHGETAGLGWIAGEVRRLAPPDASVKVPHMGWNDVALVPHARQHPVLDNGEAYFLHSYHFVPEEARATAAMSDHGGGIVAAVAHANLLGVQFHPEKSQRYGIDLLRRFLEWRP